MTRKKFWNIKKSLLIHIVNTSSTMTAEEKKRINRAIYHAGERTKSFLKPNESYKGMYEWLDKAYHMRVINGEA